jgi:hypothetical protein
VNAVTTHAVRWGYTDLSSGSAACRILEVVTMFTMYDKQGRLVMKWTEEPVHTVKVTTIWITKPRDEAKDYSEPLRAAA